MIKQTENLEAAKFFARDYAVNQPLTTTPNNVYFKPEADVSVRFTSDQGDFVIIGDDEAVSDDELFALFESGFGPLPEGWVQVSH